MRFAAAPGRLYRPHNNMRGKAMQGGQVLLFDMDGLLLDTERVFMDLSVDLLEPEGFHAQDVQTFFFSLIGSSAHETKQRLTKFLGGEKRAEQFYAKWYDALEDRLSRGIPLRPYAFETLDLMASKSHRLAVVTSTRTALAHSHLKSTGLLDFFETVTGGDAVSANKPDPAPYVETAACLGVDPRVCFAFEDSDTGTRAAVGAGCNTTQIPDLRDPSVPIPRIGQHMAESLRDAILRVGLATEAEFPAS